MNIKRFQEFNESYKSSDFWGVDTFQKLESVNTYKELIEFVKNIKEISESDRDSFLSKIVKEKWEERWDSIWDGWAKIQASMSLDRMIKDFMSAKNYRDTSDRVVKVEFDGDIVIVEPEYIMGNFDCSHLIDQYPDFEAISSRVKSYGFTKFIYEMTYCGDWLAFCHETNGPINFDKISSEKIGRKLGKVPADGGMVGVFLVDEVKDFQNRYPDKYNTSIEEMVSKGMGTLIKNFKGEVSYKIKEFGGSKFSEAVLIGKGNVNFVVGQSILDTD